MWVRVPPDASVVLYECRNGKAVITITQAQQNIKYLKLIPDIRNHLRWGKQNLPTNIYNKINESFKSFVKTMFQGLPFILLMFIISLILTPKTIELWFIYPVIGFVTTITIFYLILKHTCGKTLFKYIDLYDMNHDVIDKQKIIDDINNVR